MAPFWGDTPLWQSLAGETYERYDEHALSIRAWLPIYAEVFRLSRCHGEPRCQRHADGQRVADPLSNAGQ